MLFNSLLPKTIARLFNTPTDSAFQARRPPAHASNIALATRGHDNHARRLTRQTEGAAPAGSVVISVAELINLETLTAGDMTAQLADDRRAATVSQRTLTKAAHILNSLPANTPLIERLFSEEGCKTLVSLHQLKYIDLNACAVDAQGNTLNAIEYLCEKAGRQVPVSDTWDPAPLMLALMRAGVSPQHDQHNAMSVFMRAESSPLQDRLYAALLQAGANPFAGTPPLVAGLSANTVVALVAANFNRLFPQSSESPQSHISGQASDFTDKCITDAIARDDVALFNAVLNCANTHPQGELIRPLVLRYIIARGRRLQAGVCNAITATRYEWLTGSSNTLDVTKWLIRCSPLFCRTHLTHLCSLSTERHEQIAYRDRKFTALLNEIAQHGSVSMLAELLNSEELSALSTTSQPLRIIDAHQLLMHIAPRSSRLGKAEALAAVCQYIRRIASKDQTGQLVNPVQVANTIAEQSQISRFPLRTTLFLVFAAATLATGIYLATLYDPCPKERQLGAQLADRYFRVASDEKIEEVSACYAGMTPLQGPFWINYRWDCAEGLEKAASQYPDLLTEGLKDYLIAYKQCIKLVNDWGREEAWSEYDKVRAAVIGLGAASGFLAILNHSFIRKVADQFINSAAYKSIGQQLLDADV